MCSREVSLCYIFVVNLVTLIISLGALGFVIWAHCATNVNYYAGLAGFDARGIQVLFCVLYAIIGAVSGTAIVGIVACCCCQRCCMVVYLILLSIFLAGRSETRDFGVC